MILDINYIDIQILIILLLDKVNIRNKLIIMNKQKSFNIKSFKDIANSIDDILEYNNNLDISDIIIDILK